MKRISILGLVAFWVFLTLSSVSFAPQPMWWNTSWTYRVPLEINSSNVSRLNWPLEIGVNFTHLLDDLGESGVFDDNSIRLIEHNSTGFPMHEMPFQFDLSEGYNNETNAAGTLVFLLNGSTAADAKRYFYVYFDVGTDGVKDQVTYSSPLNYSWDGEEMIINNSLFSWYIDTIRAYNTSGIYRVLGISSQTEIFTVPATSSMTLEYLQYSNATTNLSFNLTGNLSFDLGPIKLVVTQVGNETYWNDFYNYTGETRLTKKYTFYRDTPWIKIEHNITNVAPYTVTRNSTTAGALGWDVGRGMASTYQEGHASTDPFSWGWASRQFGGVLFGIININESGTSDYYVEHSESTEKIGIQLNSTSLSQNSYMYLATVAYFNDTEADVDSFLGVRSGFVVPETVSQLSPGRWLVSVTSQSNQSIYNRGESVLLMGNVTLGDPYSIVHTMNATLDMGTVGVGDDEILVLYDDQTHGDQTLGDRIFGNDLGLEENDALGVWNMTVKAYDVMGQELNLSWHTFNVTSDYYASIEVLEPMVQNNQIVNSTLTINNYRNDTLIPGASVNCSYNSTNVTSILDYGNGSYFLNFSSPPETGMYMLACDVIKFNNTGYSSDTFNVETPTTIIEPIFQPSSSNLDDVGWLYNQSFSVDVNATVTGNATARSANISLSLPSGWSSNSTTAECGNINILETCIRTFNITVPNATTPQEFSVNSTVTWLNPNTSVYTNQTTLNVTVSSNPMISISETLLSSEVADGVETYVGNFTVWSVGNNNISDIGFTVTGVPDFAVTFLPTNFATLGMGHNQSVSVNVTIPAEYPVGTYTANITANTSNGNHDNITLEILMVEATQMSITTDPTVFDAQQISWQSNQSFLVTANSTVTGDAVARYANISIALPSGWSSNVTTADCGNLSSGQSCLRTFNVTVPNGTAPQSFAPNLTCMWLNPNTSVYSNQTSINVTVSSNPIINVTESILTNSVGDGSYGTLGNFTIWSIGNSPVTSITYTLYGLSDFAVSFSPSNVANLSMASSQQVSTNVTVPASYNPGTYNGTLTVNSSNGGYKNVTLQVVVPNNRTWIIDTSFCQRTETPDWGNVCNVTVTNIGNTQINFTVSPPGENYTTVNETNFIISKGLSHIFSIDYNVSYVDRLFYNASYMVDATDTASPDNANVTINLVPFIDPILSISLSSNNISQNSTLTILANVTDRSGTGINWTKVNITSPEGTLCILDLTVNTTSGNMSTWNLTYPTFSNSSCNTTTRGVYSLEIYTQDLSEAMSQLSTTFLVKANLTPYVSTMSDSYLQGDTGTLYYRVTDQLNNNIEGANVTVSLVDPNQNITFNTTYQTNYDGMLNPLPQFYLNSDTITGNYTMITICNYFDTASNLTASYNSNITFVVLPKSVGGLFADIETTVLWYPNNVMKFAVYVYNAMGAPVEPDTMVLTVNDPAGNRYFNISLSSFNQTGTGLYTYNYAMPLSTATGMYLATLEVAQDEFETKKLRAFRVSSGGPYDVRVVPLENEVSPGDYLDFEVTLINMGEVAQDVFVEYWTSSSNQTWFYSTEAIYVPAVTNVTVTRSAYIYNQQPLGTGYLNVKLTYSNILPSITSNTTFMVVQEDEIVIPEPPETIPSGGGAGTTVTPTLPVSNITITRFPREVSVLTGWYSVQTVQVKNNGETPIHNVSLMLIGIPTPWYTVKPANSGTLGVGDTTSFVLEFRIPKNADAGDYTVTLAAMSQEVSSREVFKVKVFISQAELIASEIAKIEDDLATLEKDVVTADKIGKNVAGIYPLIDEIRQRIASAKLLVLNESLDDAMEELSTASNVLEKAQYMLETSQFIIEYKVETIPFIYIPVIILVIAALNIIIIVWMKGMYIGVGKKVRVSLLRAKKTASMIGENKIDRDSLVNEKEKTTRLIKLLESERREGIISESAYDELRKKAEENLRRINKRIRI